MGARGSWNPADVIGSPIKKIGREINKPISQLGEDIEHGTKKAAKSVKKTVKDIGRELGGIFDFGDTETASSVVTDNTMGETPKFTLDMEAAKKRRRLLSMRRGFLATRKAGSDFEEAGVLQPRLFGKTKLG